MFDKIKPCGKLFDFIKNKAQIIDPLWELDSDNLVLWLKRRQLPINTRKLLLDSVHSRALYILDEFMKHFNNTWVLIPTGRFLRPTKSAGQIKKDFVTATFEIFDSELCPKGRKLGIKHIIPKSLLLHYQSQTYKVITQSIKTKTPLHRSSLLREYVELFPDNLRDNFNIIVVFDWLPRIAAFYCVSKSDIRFVVSTADGKFATTPNILQISVLDRGKYERLGEVDVFGFHWLGTRLVVMAEKFPEFEWIKSYVAEGAKIRDAHIGELPKEAKTLLLFESSIPEEKLVITPRSIIRKGLVLP